MMRTPQNEAQLLECCLESWNSIEVDYCKQIVDSMHDWSSYSSERRNDKTLNMVEMYIIANDHLWEMNTGNITSMDHL